METKEEVAYKLVLKIRERDEAQKVFQQKVNESVELNKQLEELEKNGQVSS